MLTELTGFAMLLFNSCACMKKKAVSSIGSQWLNPHLHAQGESRLVTAFLLSRANGSAITRISDSWLKPYTDEPLHEPRWSSVNQATRKKGKMGYRMFGSQYERLIIELISYADSRLSAGYNGK